MSSKDYLVDDFMTDQAEWRSSNSICLPLLPNLLTSCGKPDSRLKQLEDLAPEHRSVFSGYDHFNSMQSEVFDSVYLSDESLVVGAPTASGKTTILELAILRLFSNHSPNVSKVKAVYIAPLKALCSEKLQEWQQRFCSLKLRCCQFTGDSDTNICGIASYNIIITTPEKLDASSRRWAQNRIFFDQVGLIMIDEIHTVGESRGRGQCLEALLTRFVTMSSRKEANKERCPASRMRFLALSATAPNVQEIGRWLNARTFTFGDEYRPVPLKCHVIGYSMSPSSSYFKFDNSLNFKVGELIKQYSSGRSTLVFCSSRNGCYNCAKTIILSTKQSGMSFVHSAEQQQALYEVANQLKDKSIKEIVRNGVAVHNATLSTEDRHLIQSFFLNGSIKVICATTTLAQGVNLPAHLVVIKGTQVYNKSIGNTEHPSATILQMIGRAGRPQFDNFGVAVIMTTKNMVTYFRNLSSRQKAVESHLPENAVEHVNAEISLRTIASITEAINWMNNTFASIRMATSPVQFGISVHEASDSISFHKVLEKRMRHSIECLADAGMVTIKHSGQLIESTKLGTVMASYYLKLATARSIASLCPKASMESILEMLCCSSEFLDLPIRQGEKKQLNAANKAGIRYPVKGKVKVLADKISVLLQTALESHSAYPFQSVLLNQDMRNSIDISQRVVQGAISYLGEAKDQFSAYLNCFCLQKALQMRMWSDSTQVIRQIEGIGPKKVTLLISSGITTIEKLRNISSAKIEGLCDRNPPFGLQIKQRLRQFPHLQIDINATENLVQIEIQQTIPEFEVKASTSATALIGLSDNQFLCSRKLRFNSGLSRQIINITDAAKWAASEIIAFVIFDSISGCDVSVTYSLPETQAKPQNEATPKQHSHPNSQNHRKSKHQQSLEEQSQLMRQRLTHPPNKKLRIKALASDSVGFQLAQPPSNCVKNDPLTQFKAFKSNIGYNLPKLGIHSVSVNDVAQSEPLCSKIEKDMKELDEAIETCSALFDQENPATCQAALPKIFDESAFQKPQNASNNSLIYNQTASGQLEIAKNGGMRLSQSNCFVKDEEYDPSIYQSLNELNTSCTQRKLDDKQRQRQASQVYDFCDERLMFSSLFDE